MNLAKLPTAICKAHLSMKICDVQMKVTDFEIVENVKLISRQQVIQLPETFVLFRYKPLQVPK
jgi:hypothetical protein